MKIAVCSLYYWPYVRRGVERAMHDFSHFLAGRGHNVTVITTKPGPSTKALEEGVVVQYRRRMGNSLPKHFFTAWPSTLLTLARERFDLMHSYYPSYCLAASVYQHFSKFKYVFHLPGLWPKSYLFTKILSNAAVVIAPSYWLQDMVLKSFNIKSMVIYTGISFSDFQVNTEKDLDEPKILCVASLKQGFKNIPLLIEAFTKLKKIVPDAKLQLSGEVDSDTSRKLLEGVEPIVKTSIEILGVGEVEKLPHLYSEAAITVLPSEWESYGLVLIESLASGTPIVAPRSGAIPEVINRPELGILYEPAINREENVEALSKAMLAGLEHARDNSISQICRQYASQFDWEIIGPKYEELYERILS